MRSICHKRLRKSNVKCFLTLLKFSELKSIDLPKAILDYVKTVLKSFTRNFGTVLTHISGIFWPVQKALDLFNIDFGERKFLASTLSKNHNVSTFFHISL